MSPITHYLLGWLVANIPEKISRKERFIITIAGVAPDLDGFGVIAELLTRNSSKPLTWFSDFHHILCHNIGFGLLLTVLALIIAQQRVKVALLTFISFHTHIIGDLVGSKSPDGFQWPIPYLLPFSKRLELTWSGQWELNAWPNFLITGIALFLVFRLAWKRGYSPLEIYSSRADKAFVDTLRARVNFHHRDTENS